MCGKEIAENSLFCNWCGNKAGEFSYYNEGKDFIIRGGVLEKYTGQGTTIVVPNNVKMIGECAFKDCYGITKVVVPEGVSSIKWGAFENCEKLQSVEFPNTLTEISEVFRNCKSLESVKFPGSLKKIEGRLFSDCNALKKVEFEEKWIFPIDTFIKNQRF